MLAKTILSEIVDYLTDVDEEVAAAWFDEYWTGEHGYILGSYHLFLKYPN